MRKRLLKGSLHIAASFIFMLCLASTSHAVTYMDGIFSDSDWTLQFDEFIQNGGTFSSTQIATGGNPDQYREHTSTVFPGPGGNVSSGLWSFFYTPSIATYDPSTQGAIASINYMEDHICIRNCGGQGQAASIALRQNGINYWSASNQHLTNSTTWATANELGLVESNFIRLNAPGNPDFSATGAPIVFGYSRRNTTRGGGYSVTAGIDNWKVEILEAEPNVIPEPTSMILLGIGLTGAFGFRRRKAQI